METGVCGFTFRVTASAASLVARFRASCVKRFRAMVLVPSERAISTRPRGDTAVRLPLGESSREVTWVRSRFFRASRTSGLANSLCLRSEATPATDSSRGASPARVCLKLVLCGDAGAEGAPIGRRLTSRLARVLTPAKRIGFIPSILA